ncbi:hypothetical protein G3N56_15195 [Desulfovibrio sulfodismutans]|uniref:Methyltransferase domain-containing protein n=1 Tax=Desulfolutivibrio sulfodismutans TaxID=63561 RepID=A0A7K3NPH7_9BACT|nr:hypothetical protein [Desulfolutivibrio sulfodismutans]NDY58080.1 hypothetical protein [Desulfolutivibrio sulfodismutans]QLA12542.1 hypothetical protein GD606_09775 [Desulfolutivibrio sulfodismutans DSM 3696]
MKLGGHLATTFPISSIIDKKRILLYPAASGSAYLLSFLQDAFPGILRNIIGLGDKDPNKTSLRLDRLKIYAADTLAALRPDLVLVTSNSLFPAMREELCGQLGPDVPILLADAIEEYLAHEAKQSLLAQKMLGAPFDGDRDAPADNGWFHCMPLGGGRYAKSYKGVLTYRMLDQIRLPRDLTGKTVLDLAASDGFYSFECEARNALSVTAVEGPGWENPAGLKRFLHARSLYESTVKYHNARIEAFIDAPRHSYDIVLSLGIYYHLQDPLSYFAKLHALTNDMLIVTGRTIAATIHDPIHMPYDQIHGANPSMHTGRAASILLLSDRKIGKWTANVACLLDMLHIAGFAEVDVAFDYCPPGSFIASTAIVAHK